jgi:hypothetical protein
VAVPSQLQVNVYFRLPALILQQQQVFESLKMVYGHLAFVSQQQQDNAEDIGDRALAHRLKDHQVHLAVFIETFNHALLL